MKLKKAIAIVTVLCMILVFSAACTGGGESGSGDQPAATTEDNNDKKTDTADGMVDTTAFKTDKTDVKDYVIGFSDFNTVNTWRVQMERELQYHAEEELGLTLYMTNADSDSAKQVSDVQDLLSRGIDALIINAGSPTATASVMKQAISEGVPVILVNSEVDDAESYTGYVGTSAEEYGYAISKWLLEKIGNKGDIIVVDGIAGNAVSVLRNDGLKKALSELPDGGKSVNILNTYPGDWAYDKGKQIGEQALAAYPKFDAVWSQGGAMSQGIIEAFQAAKRPLVPITGEDNNGFLKMWKNGQADGFTSIAAADPTWQSAYALDVAIKVLQGESIKKMDYIEIPVITDENLDEYVRMDYSDAYWCNSHLPKEYADKYYLEN